MAEQSKYRPTPVTTTDEYLADIAANQDVLINEIRGLRTEIRNAAAEPETGKIKRLKEPRK